MTSHVPGPADDETVVSVSMGLAKSREQVPESLAASWGIWWVGAASWTRSEGSRSRARTAADHAAPLENRFENTVGSRYSSGVEF